MTTFEINGVEFKRCQLGIADFKRLAKNIKALGFNSLQHFMEQGAQPLFESEKIYLYLALLFAEKDKADFNDKIVAERQKLFYEHDVPPEVAGEACSFFFEKLIALLQSSPATAYMILRMGQTTNGVAAKSRKKPTSRKSSKKSSAKQPAATPLGVVSSKAKTSAS